MRCGRLVPQTGWRWKVGPAAPGDSVHLLLKFTFKICNLCVAGRSFSKSVNNELTKFERYATEKYLLKKHQRDIDTKVYLTRERCVQLRQS